MRDRAARTLKRNVLIPWEMMAALAFRSLSASGIRVLLAFMQRRTWTKKGRRNVVFQNGGLALTYGDAARLGVSASQYLAILKRLVAVGFLDQEHQGGWAGRDFSRYRLSERWRKFGQPDFVTAIKGRVLWPGHDVKAWQTKKAAENRSCKLRESAAIGRRDRAGGNGKPQLSVSVADTPEASTHLQ